MLDILCNFLKEHDYDNLTRDEKIELLKKEHKNLSEHASHKNADITFSKRAQTMMSLFEETIISLESSNCKECPHNPKK